MLLENDFHAEMVQLCTALIPDIDDDYRASEDPSDDTPGMQVTIGADADGWSYQTGDNSFTGGAYSYATWAVTSIYRDTDPRVWADDVVSQLYDGAPDHELIFGHWFSTSSGRVEIQLGAEHAREGSQPGKDASEDIEALMRIPYIREQLDAIDAQTLAGELKEYGAWDSAELADHDANLTRILWLACGDIREGLAS